MQDIVRRAIYRLVFVAPFIACLALLLAAPSLRALASCNLLVQATLFLALAHLPAARTGRMSYVDVAWPWGLVAIGVEAWCLGTGWETRRWIAGTLYVAMGLRMGLPGWQLWAPGALRQDFARYRYQRLRWARHGYRSETLSMQYEIGLQGLFNATVLALPAMVLTSDPANHFHGAELAGYALFAVSWMMEMIADQQKARFMRAARAANDKRALCDQGLWRYSRHPNYFFEWMVWNGLVLAALPSLSAGVGDLGGTMSSWGLGVALPAASALMYWVLVHYTGAVPAEHYSVLRRPGYVWYQRRTSRFFPAPPRLPPDSGEIPH